MKHAFGHLPVVALILTALISTAQAQPPSIPKHVFPSRGSSATNPAGGAATQTGTAGNGISYHGGPIMTGTPNLYYIWYGNWAADPGAVTILQRFAQNDGGSPYYGINTTYYDGSNTPITNALNYSNSYNDNYSRGKTLGDSDILAIVSSAITGGHLPSDPNGIYFVLTWQDVQETSGFITQYCGWHSYASIGGVAIKYAFIGNANTQGLGSCSAQQASSPNNNPAADAMASVLAHELEEATTDPLLNAWYDSSGNENADKCAWTFGTTYFAANGSYANMKLGGYDYLIQQNWVNASGGYCALSLPNQPSLTAITPTSGSQGVSVPVTITGTNLTGSTVAVSGTGVTVTLGTVTATQISATFTIAAGATASSRSVTVTNAAGTSNAVTFTVIAAAVATPTFTPAAGSYTSAQSVTISTATPGASIRFTTDGTTPSSTVGTLYSGPVSVAASLTLKAIAYATGMTDSAVASAAYVISGGGGGGSTITLVATSTGICPTSFFTSNCTATSAPANFTGATLLVAVEDNYYYDPTANIITDSNGNTWHHVTAQRDANFSGSATVIWYAYDKSGSPLVTGPNQTVTISGGLNQSFNVSAWSGTLTGSDPFDVENGFKPSSSADYALTVRPGTITPRQGNELVIAGVGAIQATDSSMKIDSGFTSLTAVPETTGVFSQAAYLVQGTAAAVNPTWTGGAAYYHSAVIASFKAGSGGGGTTTVAITVNSSPAGLSLLMDGVACTAPCTQQWAPGSTHVIAVPGAPQSGGSGIQYVYASWSDGGAASHSITVPSSATTYTASFATQFFLTTSAGTGGAITPASAWYNSGSVVSVAATANSGYTFSGFSGSLTGTTTPQSLTMNAPKSVSAAFTVSGGGGGGGVISLVTTSTGICPTPFFSSNCSATSAPANMTGATLLVVVEDNYYYDPATTAISDSNGNTWHRLTSQTDANFGGSATVIWYAYDKAGSPLVAGANQTIMISGGLNHSFNVSAWRGTLTGSDPLDVQSGFKPASSADQSMTVHTGGITPSQSKELIIAGVGAIQASDSSMTIDSGFVSLTSVPETTGVFSQAAYLIQTTSGAVNPGWTGSTPYYHTAVIAAFKPAP